MRDTLSSTIFIYIMEIATLGQKMFTINEVFKHGWEITKKYWVQYIFFMLAAGVVGMVIGLISAMSSNSAWNFVWSVVMIAYEMVIVVAGVRLIMGAVDGKKIEYKDLLTTDWMLFLYVLGTVVLLCIAVMAGTILFVIPGIILAAMFLFSIYIAVEKKMNPIDAMKASKNLTDGSKMDIFVFYLSIIGVHILLWIVPSVLFVIAGLIGGTFGTIIAFLGGICMLVAIVGMIILSMVSNFGIAYIYRTLSNKKPEAFKVA